ncbi:hypothetical protein YTPLAS73_01630 [Nitrosarchaeum sp.]|nr:hypothetical protein YTPLAS73_01630 [Nitrosarchaeum sp.]
MTSVDKVGIIISIAIVAVAVGFTLTGEMIISSDVKPNMDKVIVPLKELSEETTKTVETIKESGSKVASAITEKSQELTTETKQLSEKAKEMTEQAKELATSKLPARLVSIPKGTSVPGCEGRDECYDPPNPIIFVGGEVIWKNNDNNAHTVTSGTTLEGPDGNFDSGLLKPNEVFSHKFDKVGEYQYFCMIHPWAKGSIIVK